MVYLQLFIAFLKIGVLGFGGGMAIISLIRNEVMSYGWMSETEFVDIVAISQVTPGPIGMNCATYVGYTAGGLLGSLVASVSVILPGVSIMLLISTLYEHIRDRWKDNRLFRTSMRIIRILVVLLIAHAAFRLMTPASFIDYRSWIIFAVVLVAMLFPLLPCVKSASKSMQRVTEIVSHPILLIVLAGITGFMLYH